MIEDLGFRLLLGHLVADYLFQPKKMALEKTSKNWKGVAWCFAHSALYALAISIASEKWGWATLLFFVSHYPIDRWSLAQKWLDLIGGRNLLNAYNEKRKYWEIDIVFSSLVYTVTDNTLHLLLIYLIANN
jgi:hypothetical protein